MKLHSFKRFSWLLIMLIAAGGAPAQENVSPKDDPKQTSSGLGGFLSDLANSVRTAAKKPEPAASSLGDSTQKRLRDTDLNGLFNRTKSAQWPRVALTINTLPTWFYQMPPSGRMGGFSPSDCIVVSLTVWQNERRSKTYNNVNFCGNDQVTEVPFSDVGLIWKNFGLASKTLNTGNIRTTGPKPPEHLFPNKPGLDMFFRLNGSYYLGSIMATLGYNWKEPQDFRFWVVDLPTQADSVNGVSIASQPTPATEINSNESADNNPPVSTKCASHNFSTEKFNRIAVGMSIDKITALIGCKFDPYFTQTSSYGKSYVWSADEGSMASAYMITVFFDSTGTKVKPIGATFKTAQGF